jgi:hypothetical protein
MSLQGTLFVLVREPPVLQLLLEATQGPGKDFDKAEQVLAIAEEKSNLSDPRPAFSDKVVGKWRLRWSAQVIKVFARIDSACFLCIFLGEGKTGCGSPKSEEEACRKVAGRA